MDLPILVISCKWNHILCWASFLAWRFQTSFMPCYVSILHSFLWLNILWYIYTTCLSSHQFVDYLGCFVSLLLWIMLLWTFLFKFLFECFRFSWGIQLRGNVMSYETLIRPMLIHFMAFHKSLRIYFFFFHCSDWIISMGLFWSLSNLSFACSNLLLSPHFSCYYTIQLLNFCLNDFWHITDIFYLMTLFSDF